jgi:diacylglycerol kinase (ATP)
MRAAAILGPGCSPKNLKVFQDKTDLQQQIDWQIGMPTPADQANAVLIFGGDGTFHRHLAQLVKLDLPVLVVPAGSGNDFARALGLRTVKHSLAAWRKFCMDEKNVRMIDLGIIEPCSSAPATITPTDTNKASPDPALDPQRYFCAVAGVGLDAEVAHRANRLPRWLRGHGGYVMSLVSTIFRFAPLPVKILIRENSRAQSSDARSSWTLRSHQPTILAAFANTPTYGGGMKIAPQAQMDDGTLDICVIKALDPLKLFCLFPTVYFGHHLQIREVEYFQSSHLRVETEPPLDIFADGEYICRTPVEIRVASKVLKVVTP